MANVFLIHIGAETNKRLVRAANKAQALRFVANDTLRADIASADDVYVMAVAGIKIEEAETVRDLADEARQAGERG